MDRLFNNFGLKLGALALAILLSFFVYEYINFPTSQTIYLPLVVRNLNPQLVFSSPAPFPSNIYLQVRGPYRSIRQISASKVPAVVNCENINEPGEYSLNIDLPDLGEIVVTDQERKFLDTTIEEKAEKTFSVAVNRLGEIDPNFSIVDENLSRTTVRVSGPKTMVALVESAVIQVSVEGLDSDLRTDLPVVLRGGGGQSISAMVHRKQIVIDPAVIAYTLRVVPGGTRVVLKVIPATVGQPPEGYLLDRLHPNPPLIQLESDLVPKGVSAILTRPIDLTNARASFTVTIALEYPFEIPEDSGLPLYCDVGLEIISLEEHGIRLQPDLIGRNPDYHYIITPPQISLISDDFVQMAEQKKSQITAVLYLEGLGVGEHIITPQLFLPAELASVKINPSKLSVTIIKREE